jgi:hypothetical protein
MTHAVRPAFVIEFELDCALERRDIYANRPQSDDMISRFQVDQNRREIERLTAELELARSQQ